MISTAPKPQCKLLLTPAMGLAQCLGHREYSKILAGEGDRDSELIGEKCFFLLHILLRFQGPLGSSFVTQPKDDKKKKNSRKGQISGPKKKWPQVRALDRMNDPVRVMILLRANSVRMSPTPALVSKGLKMCRSLARVVLQEPHRKR